MKADISNQPELIKHHNDVFRFWLSVWKPTMKSMGDKALDFDQILKQNYICFIKSNGTVIASHFYSKYDIRAISTKHTSYFKDSFETLSSYCNELNLKTVMTQEYLSVHPEWRKHQIGFSIAEVVIGLAIKMMNYTSSDSTAGTIRAGAPSVEVISKSINADLLPVTVKRYGNPHKLFIVSQENVIQPGNKITNKVIEQLWNKKTDFIKKSNSNYNQIKIAA